MQVDVLVRGEFVEEYHCSSSPIYWWISTHGEPWLEEGVKFQNLLRSFLRAIYCRLAVHTPCLKSDIDPSTDISNMTCAVSLEVDKGLSDQNITLNMANRDLQEELCAFGALTPYVMDSTAFLTAKGGMMSFPPCLLIGQRRQKQWFMILHAPLNHIAWQASPIFLLTHCLLLTHFTPNAIPSAHLLPFFWHMPMWIPDLHALIPVLLNVEMAAWIAFTNLSATCPRIARLFTQKFFSLSGINYQYEKWKALRPKFCFVSKFALHSLF